jgi:hypothetical protein
MCNRVNCCAVGEAAPAPLRSAPSAETHRPRSAFASYFDPNFRAHDGTIFTGARFVYL